MKARIREIGSDYGVGRIYDFEISGPYVAPVFWEVVYVDSEPPGSETAVVIAIRKAVK